MLAAFAAGAVAPKLIATASPVVSTPDATHAPAVKVRQDDRAVARQDGTV